MGKILKYRRDFNIDGDLIHEYEYNKYGNLIYELSTEESNFNKFLLLRGHPSKSESWYYYDDDNNKTGGKRYLTIIENLSEVMYLTDELYEYNEADELLHIRKFDGTKMVLKHKNDGACDSKVGNYIFEYDDYDNIVHIKNFTRGYEEWRYYDIDNNMIHTKNSNDEDYWYEYDVKGYLIRSITPDEEIRYTNFYDEDGDIIKSISSEHKTIIFYYYK